MILPFGSSTSVHSYWDSQIPGNINMPPAVRAASASREEAIENFLATVYDFEAEQDAINSAVPVTENAAPPEKWVDEWWLKSLEAAREAYRTLTITAKVGGKYRVSSTETKAQYNARCTPIVTERMTSAALNLAKLLNTILVD